MKFQDLAAMAEEEGDSPSILGLLMVQETRADAARKADRALDKARRQARKWERAARLKGAEIATALAELTEVNEGTVQDATGQWWGKHGMKAFGKLLNEGKECVRGKGVQGVRALAKLIQEGKELVEVVERWQATETRLERTVRKEYLLMAKAASALLPYEAEELAPV